VVLRSLRSRFSWLVIAPFLIVLGLMASLGVASAGILSSVRAYVGGESLWSKGQKDAVYHLANFAASKHAADFDRFSAALTIPLGDQRARLQLEQAVPDLTVVRAGFLQGGNHPDDVDGMIWLFRNFRQVEFMADAIAIWAEADLEINALDDLAGRIRRQVDDGTADPQQMQALMLALGTLNDRLTELELRFSATLGKASRTAANLVLGATLLLGVVLVAAAVALSLRALRRQSRVESALRSSEERLQRALDASGLALWDFDVKSGKVYLSEAWKQRLSGQAGVTHTTFAELANRVPESERDGLMACLVATLKNQTPTYSVEHRVRRDDGTWLWNLSEGRVVERDAAGVALRMVGTNRDVTDRKHAEAERAHLESQLRESQKMEAIGTLAGGIAHDFNNILGVIRGNVALAREDIGVAHAATASLEQIDTASVRGRRLVQQILAYSRRQPQELTVRALRPLVTETMALMRSTLPAGVELELEVAESPLPVRADHTQMQQVLMNLCTNAWHALQGKGGRVTVGLRAVELALDSPERPTRLPAGRYAHLRVADDGCGMDAATAARIFEPFFTTKPKGQGTGLGLSVVHGIVASHQGAITVQSSPGAGSTFDVYLPLVETHSVPGDVSEWGVLGPADDSGRSRHVVYVDDDEAMLLLVDRLLSRLGYRVTCFQDAREALQKLRRQGTGVDLVISDFNMPQCSGLDVADALAATRPGLPVVISTGYITEELLAAADCGRVHGLMQKENTVEDLGGVVQGVFQGMPVGTHPAALLDPA
jgi:PAS domain S-box-containing protein